jgi:hypothetical protein
MHTFQIGDPDIANFEAQPELAGRLCCALAIKRAPLGYYG